MLFVSLSACVERIYFEVPLASSQIVVEGLITDGPAPYTVKVGRALKLDIDSVLANPISRAIVTLFDDEGRTDSFTEVAPGEYRSSGLIRGQVGRSYHIRVVTPEGRIIESEPDMLTDGGEITNIRFEYEPRTIERSWGIMPADVFNIYIDAETAGGASNFVRWRYNGTFQIRTYPELRVIWLQGFQLMDPLPCSGFYVAPQEGGGRLESFGECVCCTCWVKEYEPAPVLSDAQFVANNQYRNVKVGEVPISPESFSDRYQVMIEQMSMTRTSYEFFKLIRAQKQGATSLFQPPSGELIGNVKGLGDGDPVVGLFWASSVTRKIIYLTPQDLPYRMPLPDPLTADCRTFFRNSDNTPPPFWQ